MNNGMNRGEQIEEIKQVLISDRTKFYKLEEIEDYLKKYNLNNTELFEIVNAMASDNYIFRWLYYISAKIPLLTIHKEFLILLKKVITKIKGDMAQGIFINALISIGEQDPNQGIALYEQMIISQDSDLIGYSSFPLGGAGKKNFARIYKYIKEDFENPSPDKKVASLKTIRVANEKVGSLQNTDQIFELIDKGSLESEDLAVRLQATEAYFELSPFKYDHCIKRLFELAENGGSEIRYTLAQKVWLQDLKNKEDEIKILSACSKDENRNVLSRVSIALSKKGSIFPELSLNIIKYWILNGKYFDVHDIDYSIREIGKGNLSRSIAEIVTWIAEEDKKKYLEFYIPIVLKEVSSSNHMTLLQSIETWWEKNERFEKIAIETLRNVLSEMYPPSEEKVAIINAYFTLLEIIAKKENLNIDVLIDGESEKLFQCMLIIDELRGVHKKLDFDLIAKNLKTYPAIRDFLGQQWFESFIGKDNENHPLLAILSSELDNAKLNAAVEAFQTETSDLKKYMLSLKIRNIVTPTAYLGYLDEMIKITATKSQKLKDLRDGLRNSRMFFDIFSELEAISSFIQDYAVEIGPELDGKKLDLRIGLNPDIYVEVISPDMFKPLKYLNGKAMGIRNRTRGKILDELKHHFKDVDALGETPWVIIVDLSRSEISDDFVEDALMGSEQFTLFLNKENGKVVGQSLSRTNDSVHDINSATDILSAVIYYKTNLGTDCKLHREGKIVTNSHAKNPLSEELLGKIKKQFFG
jgi:hypothetical protein